MIEATLRSLNQAPTAPSSRNCSPWSTDALNLRPLSEGDFVAKVFLGWRTRILRAADAFCARRRERPHRFIQNRPGTSVVALKSDTAAEKSKDQLSRDFRVARFSTFATWGNSGIEPDKGKGIALQERMRPASCGLPTMESGNGILYRTERVVEANIDLRGGPEGSVVREGVVDSDPEAISVS